jgi:hypothetical protein
MQQMYHKVPLLAALPHAGAQGGAAAGAGAGSGLDKREPAGAQR